MSHTCSSALVRCMDFRLGSAIQDYLNSHDLYDDVDIISIAGAAKDIAQKNESFAESQVLLSKQLHSIEKVVLMNHTDCGGYGGRDAFDSDETERAQHHKDLSAARAKLLITHPDLDVHLALAVISQDGKVTIEEL